MKGVLVLAAAGPVLLLSSYPRLDDPDFIARLRAKGMEKFIAWEVPIERCKDLYGYTFRDEAENLTAHEGMHVLDTDGHRIFLNFQLSQLSAGIVYEDRAVTPIR